MVQCSEILGRCGRLPHALPHRKALRVAGAAWAMALLLGNTGCGQKGDLYLAPTTAAPANTHSSTPAPLRTDTTLSTPRPTHTP
ncbi:MAG: lipoprotein [Macromonas sp.]